jgi:ketosteroid isomerase-like protein
VSNAETVQRIYESWREEKGIPADLVDSEIEWVNPPDAIEPGTRHGPEGVSVALANFSRAYRIAGLEVERMVAAGESVATSVNLTFVGRGSGMEVHNRQSHRFTFRDGRVVRIEWSSDPDRLFEEIDEG